MALQQFGNVKYTGWLLQVPCSKNEEIVDVLQQQAKAMEAELHEWQYNVKTTRLEFYELNYYTTRQLLMLRKEFGAVKNLEVPAVSPNSLALLQSISSKVTSEMVCDVVKCTPQSIPEGIPNAGTAEHSQEPPMTSSPASPGLSMNDEIMASADHHVSARASSEAPVVHERPTLTVDDLTEDEKKILAYVVSRLECSDTLVLKAFEECRGKEMDKYDYQNWCVEYSEKYSFSDGDDEISDDEEPLFTESESESDDQEFTSVHGMVIILYCNT